MAFTKITAAGIGSTETVTLDGLSVINNGSFGGNLTVSGVLTYEDVTNVDSVGVITARAGVLVGSGITLSKDGDVFFTGIATGDGSGLTALNASNISSGTVPTARLGSGTASSSTFLRGDSTFQTVNTDLVSDTSPQLGGSLDMNNQNITSNDSSGGGNNRIVLGTGSDLNLYSDGDNVRYEGNNLQFKNANGDEFLAKMTNGGAVELYYNNVKKFETLTNGVQITGSEFISEGTILLEKSGAHHHRILSNDSGNDLAFQQSSDTGANTNFTTYLRINDGGNISLPVDNQRLRLGASADLELFHNGSHSYIQDNGTGALYIGSNGGGVYVRGQHGEESIIANSNGAVELYHDNVKKMETTSVGVTMNDTVITNGEVRPANDNTHSIGRSNRRYITYFGVNGSINTSDRNEKNTIVDSDLGLDFINKLNPVSYKWNKDDGKTHYGLIVQDLEETLTSIGKTVSDFGGIYKEPNSPMGLGYSELISPLIKAVQELSVENAALKARLDAAGL